MVRCGEVRHGVVWCGVVRCGMVRCGVIWYDVVKCGEVWCAVVCGIGVMWFDVIRLRYGRVALVISNKLMYLLHAVHTQV